MTSLRILLSTQSRSLITSLVFIRFGSSVLSGDLVNLQAGYKLPDYILCICRLVAGSSVLAGDLVNIHADYKLPDWSLPIGVMVTKEKIKKGDK